MQYIKNLYVLCQSRNLLKIVLHLFISYCPPYIHPSSSPTTTKKKPPPINQPTNQPNRPIHQPPTTDKLDSLCLLLLLLLLRVSLCLLCSRRVYLLYLFIYLSPRVGDFRQLHSWDHWLDWDKTQIWGHPEERKRAKVRELLPTIHSYYTQTRSICICVYQKPTNIILITFALQTTYKSIFEYMLYPKYIHKCCDGFFSESINKD